MKVPVKITLQGRDVPIRYVKKIPGETEDDPSYGEFCHIEKVITINKVRHKSGPELFSTVYHEMLHAIMDITGQNTGMSNQREEVLVRAFENSLYGVLQFNVHSPLIKWREVKFPFESGTPDEESE